MIQISNNLYWYEQNKLEINNTFTQQQPAILEKNTSTNPEIELAETNILNNKNNDPSNVYKNKKKLALTLLLDPNNPININRGGNILSKKI